MSSLLFVILTVLCNWEPIDLIELDQINVSDHLNQNHPSVGPRDSTVAGFHPSLFIKLAMTACRHRLRLSVGKLLHRH